MTLSTHAGLRLLGMLGLALAVAWGPFCAAQSETEEAEYRVKAAFLYKFGSYIEWPDGTFERPNTPLAIGVAGADVLADKLAQAVSGRIVGGRPVTVRKLRRGEPVKGLHILFIGRMQEAQLAEFLAASKGFPILTVTESENGLALGSMINFVVIEDKVRFEVAPKAARSRNLIISALLISVAYKIVSEPS
jgi:hypothetical protein